MQHLPREMPVQAQTAMLRCRQTDPQDVSVHNRIAAQQFVPADGAVEIDLHAAGIRGPVDRADWVVVTEYVCAHERFSFLCKFEFYYLLKHIKWEPTFGWEVQKDRHQGLPQPRARHVPAVLRRQIPVYTQKAHTPKRICAFSRRYTAYPCTEPSPKLTASASSTCRMAFSSSDPIFSRRRRLSSVRICSVRMIESLVSP